MGVFTCLDQTLADHHDVVPFRNLEYPTCDQVHCCVLSFHRQTLTTFSWTPISGIPTSKAQTMANVGVTFASTM